MMILKGIVFSEALYAPTNVQWDVRSPIIKRHSRVAPIRVSYI